MSSDDREEIERKTQALEQSLERHPAEDVSAVGRGRPGRRFRSGIGRRGREKKEDVLDAEFEEVKESDRKKA